MDVIVYLNVIG